MMLGCIAAADSTGCRPLAGRHGRISPVASGSKAWCLVTKIINHRAKSIDGVNTTGPVHTDGRCWWRTEQRTVMAAAIDKHVEAHRPKRISVGRDEDDGFDGGEALEPGARPATARRLKMVVAYDGSNFAGFQFQPGKVRTVQGELERCAKRLFLGSSRMVGASRTDGGAHAYGQVVHFDVYGDRDSLEADVLYYNSFLPPDVRVLSLSYAEDGFDSHFSSCGKTYLYKFAGGLQDPLQSKYRWCVYDRWCERSRGKPSRLSDVELDVGRMSEAAQLLLGRHDFSAFMDNKRPAGLGSTKRKNPKLAERGIKPERTSVKNTRILSHLTVTESISPISGGQEVVMEVTGNGFLYRMVRMLAAGLVEVGHRRRTPTELQQLLVRADRSFLPEAAPPHGLYLAAVHYPEDPLFEARVEQLTERIHNAVSIRAGVTATAGRSTVEEGSATNGVRDGIPVVLKHQGSGVECIDEWQLTEIKKNEQEGTSSLRKDAGDDSFACVASGDLLKAEANAVTGLWLQQQGMEDGVGLMVRELRMTQGQKAAMLMRAAAAARCNEDDGGTVLDGGKSRGEYGGQEGGGGARDGEEAETWLGSIGGPHGGHLDYSQLKNREDDQ